MNLIERNGVWWPESDQSAYWMISAEVHTDVPAFLAHVPGRNVIVQAGANVGVYPIALARHFGTVLTVEPDEENYECFKRNLKASGVKNVAHMRAAFGEDKGRCAIEIVHPHNTGAHRIKPDYGDIEILRIDDLPLGSCDAIWLDIEGYELSALKGAEATIDRFSPVISIEDKGLHGYFGIPPGAVQAWLAERGYSQVARIGNDKVFKR